MSTEESQELETETRSDGATPAGGAYAIAYWQDASGNPVDRSKWVQAEIIEFTADGEHLMRTYMQNAAATLDELDILPIPRSLFSG